MSTQFERAQFGHMRDGTEQVWYLIAEKFKHYVKGLPDRILDHLALLDGDYGGFQVDRLKHSLQTATLAYKDGQDEEYVVCALLHDIGDHLGSYNHADLAAAILQPFVSTENYWMIKHHAIFQGYYFFHHLGLDRNAREEFKQFSSLYKRTAKFCEAYDAAAFDPDAETFPLDFFEPMLRRIFAQPKSSIYLPQD